MLLAVPLLAVPASVSLTALLPVSPAEAKPSGGNTVVYSTTAPYTATHTFTTDGTFTVPAGANPAVGYIVVAGGAGGGNFVAGTLQAAAGGGGAGGMLNSGVPGPVVGPGTYPVVVGLGGAGGTNGTNSSWNGVTALGGGRGASVNTGSDAAASSGPGITGTGGGSRCGIAAGGAGTAGQGSGGGAAQATCSGVAPNLGAINAGAGGGGATFSGSPATTGNTAGGAGGGGRAGFVGRYAGGGGGGASRSGSNVNGGSASDGGGRGAGQAAGAVAGNGIDGQGGGGGGGNAVNPTGGRGGNGVVILRYAVGFLSYNANNGSGAVPGDSDYLATGETAAVAGPGPLTRTGYDFNGWNTASGGGGTAYQPAAVYTAPASPTKVTLFAQWAAHHYQVAFDPNGADGGTAIGNQAFVYDTAQNLTKNLWTRTGYTFAGWTQNPNGTGTIYTDQQSVLNLSAVDGDVVTLHAKWVPIGYSVSFDDNGSDGGTAIADQPFVYDTAQDLTKNLWTRTGYSFGGWTENANGTGATYADEQNVKNLSATAGAVVPLHAKWDAHHYSVAFDPNGADGGTAIGDQAFVYDTAQDLTKNQWTRTGYTFGGWTQNADGTGTAYADQANVTNLSAVDGDVVTLHAKWVPIDYSVSFDDNGSDGGTAIGDQAFVYDVAQDLTKNLWTRTGYTFGGWTENANGTGAAYADEQNVKNLSAIAGAVVPLHAKWNANHYQVAFDKGAGAGTMAPQDFVYDTTENLDQNQFTRTGYSFDHWTDGSGTSYANQAPVTNLTSDPGGVVPLVAQWTAIGYRVVFDGNGADGGSTSAQAFVYDTEQKLTPNGWTRTGYDFAGWNSKADGSGTSYADEQAVTNLSDVDGSTVTLYAQWSAHHYTVSFAANGGARLMPAQAFVYGTPQALAANTLTRSGFRFAGWNTAQNGSGTSYADRATVVNLTAVDQGNVTLYAQWEESTPATGGSEQPPSLPETGGPSLWLLVLGLLALAGGVLVLVLVSRRRR